MIDEDDDDDDAPEDGFVSADDFVSVVDVDDDDDMTLSMMLVKDITLSTVISGIVFAAVSVDVMILVESSTVDRDNG